MYCVLAASASISVFSHFYIPLRFLFLRRFCPFPFLGGPIPSLAIYPNLSPSCPWTEPSILLSFAFRRRFWLSDLTTTAFIDIHFFYCLLRSQSCGLALSVSSTILSSTTYPLPAIPSSHIHPHANSLSTFHLSLPLSLTFRYVKIGKVKGLRERRAFESVELAPLEKETLHTYAAVAEQGWL